MVKYFRLDFCDLMEECCAEKAEWVDSDDYNELKEELETCKKALLEASMEQETLKVSGEQIAADYLEQARKELNVDICKQ